MHDVASIRAKFEALGPYLDERRRRLWAAAEAMVLGRGGITAVANATGLQRTTIRVGMRELQASPTAGTETEATAADRVQRVRAPGGGRKPMTSEDPSLVQDLEALVEPVTRGDPMSPLRWTCKSPRQLAAELVRQGHQVSHQTVAHLLHALDYSLQSTRKTKDRKAPTTPTAMPSSPTSATRRVPSSSAASRRSPSTARRNSWSAISRTAGANGSQPATPNRCGCTTSWTGSWARRSPLGSTTWQPTRAG